MVLRILFLAFLLGLLSFLPSSVAAQSVRTFQTPKINNVRLDWCKHWGRQCGGPAATLYCKEKGYDRAKSWQIDPNVGARDQATVVFGDGRICRAPNCSSFRSITCTKGAPKKPAPREAKPKKEPRTQDKKRNVETKPAGKKEGHGSKHLVPAPSMVVVPGARGSKTYRYPHIKRVRLDWCKHKGRKCGKPAATLFCKEMGFKRASAYKVDQSIGMRGVRTLHFGDGSLCKSGNCKGFKKITCVGKGERPETIARPGDTKAPGAKEGPTVRPGPITEETGKGSKDTSTAHLPPHPATFMPGGAELLWCLGDCFDQNLLKTGNLELAQGDSKTQKWIVEKVPGAAGVLWQASERPFPPFQGGSNRDLKPNGLLGSALLYGKSGAKSGTFYPDFKTLWAKRSSGRLKLPNRPNMYVRALPVGSRRPLKVVGQPTNTLGVYYGIREPGQTPYTVHIPKPDKSTYPDPLFDIQIVGFEPAVFEDPNKWGCVKITGYKGELTWTEKKLYPLESELCPEPYSGGGRRITSVGDFIEWSVDKAISAWDWVGNAFDDIKAAAVNVVMKYSGFSAVCDAIGTKSECKTAASTALNAGLVAVGVPPTIPSYNELVDKGADYAVELARKQIEEASPIPCIGPCEDALRAGVKKFTDELKRQAKKPGCVGKKKANRHGKRPYCPPSFLITKAAKGALSVPPYLTVRVTRRSDVPYPTRADHPECVVTAGMKILNHIPKGKKSIQYGTGTRVLYTDVKEQDIEQTLYEADNLPIPHDLEPGQAVEIHVTFNRMQKFIFSWTRRLYVDAQVGVIPDHETADWFTLYRGGTAKLDAGSNCSEQTSRIERKLPSDI